MTIRETAIAKIQQLPESLVQQIIDFIDFIARNYQAKTAIDSLEGDRFRPPLKPILIHKPQAKI